MSPEAQERVGTWQVDYWRDRAVKAEAHASDLRRALLQAEEEVERIREFAELQNRELIQAEERLREAERERDDEIKMRWKMEEALKIAKTALGDYERMGEVPLNLRSLQTLARALLQSEERLKIRDERIEFLSERLQACEKALERLLYNAQLIFNKRPVRDWAETLAEAKAALDTDEKP